MTDQNLTSLNSGASLTAFATLLLGPLLGEYSVILIMGALGTLVAMSETTQPSFRKSIVFFLRGLSFSFVFTSLATALLVKYVLPDSSGFTPYVILGPVSFLIGWSNDRLTLIKSALLARVTDFIQGGSTQMAQTASPAATPTADASTQAPATPVSPTVVTQADAGPSNDA